MNIQRELGVTTVFVTHDQNEAVLMADRIALMFDGSLHQYSEPSKFYSHPNSLETAKFFGSVNFIPAHREEDKLLVTPMGQLLMEAKSPLRGDVLFTMRPEQIELGVQMPHNTATGIIQSMTFVGAYLSYRVIIGDTPIEVHRSAGLPQNFKVGQSLPVYFPPDYIWILPESGHVSSG
ncbi:MAG: TOBE domain-containing protein [Chloroflexota bacterium]